jgi:hypothetical protein
MAIIAYPISNSSKGRFDQRIARKSGFAVDYGDALYLFPPSLKESLAQSSI